MMTCLKPKTCWRNYRLEMMLTFMCPSIMERMGSISFFVRTKHQSKFESGGGMASWPSYKPASFSIMVLQRSNGTCSKT